MICHNCKKEIADDSMFCEFCGTKQQSAPQPEQSVQQEQPVQPVQPVQQVQPVQ